MKAEKKILIQESLQEIVRRIVALHWRSLWWLDHDHEQITVFHVPPSTIHEHEHGFAVYLPKRAAKPTPESRCPRCMRACAQAENGSAGE
jgi:hypothetical protein